MNREIAPRASQPGAQLAPLLVALTLTWAVVLDARGDTFHLRDESGSKRTLEGRLVAEATGFLVVEHDDGQWEIVQDASIVSRKASPPPAPISAAEMARRLEARFGQDLVRTHVAGSVVVAMVLAAPLDEGESGQRLERFLDKASRFMESVDRIFTRFADDLSLPIEPVTFPQVLLIFERDHDFEEYAVAATGGQGLSASRIAGFYSALTNWLAIRIDECDSFAVPLHEAIHQQVFNRGLMQRLAPVPVWFNEGIATGFENDGQRISTDPTKINRLYAARSLMPLSIQFGQIIADDAVFHGDVLAGDAYTLAWALHWTLVTQRPEEYAAYVTELGKLAPLQKVSANRRVEEFEALFRLRIAELPATFVTELRRQSQKQRVRIEPPRSAVGNLSLQDQTGAVEIGIVHRADLGGLTQFIGRLRNISPIRALTFRVSLYPPNGAPIRWTEEEVAPGRTVSLDRQRIRNPGGSSFRVEILSALPDSREAQKWAAEAATSE